VCTHRANLVVRGEGALRGLRCGYHGRRFALDGRFLSMPEFEGAQGFPSPADDLPRASLARWGPLVFAALDPAVAFDAWIGPLRERLAWLPLDAARRDPAAAPDYEVRASWILYCDNYLEGFHIPYVHHGLASTLDYAAYRTETFDHGSLQVGIARDGEPALEPPAHSADRGQRIAGYYAWLFPNLMLNFYPWGLSVNIVQPLAVDRTRIRYAAYVWDAARRGEGAGGDLHRVELEDDDVVESAQRGVRSRLYDRGRFSPTREVGVHHFHRLLARSLDGGTGAPEGSA
jgi:choline monooxygenase